jgi:transcription elongation factor GreA
MTRKSYEKLSAEARRLKEVEVPRVSKEKLEAAAQGDLRENAGYEAARDRLNLINARINQIAEQLTGTQFIEDLKIPANVVTIGTRVKLLDLDETQEVEYCILGPADADVGNKIISFQSPLARAMIAKKISEEFSAVTPGGERNFRILAIERYGDGTQPS